MLGVLILVLLALAADVGSLVWIGAAYGALWALVAVLAGFVVAALLFKLVGPWTAVRVANRMRAGELPGRELVDALLVVAGAVLFASPGVVSDAFALVLVLPGLRALPRLALARWVRRRGFVVGRTAGSEPPRPADDPRGRPPPSGEGGTIDVDFRRE